MEVFQMFANKDLSTDRTMPATFRKLQFMVGAITFIEGLIGSYGA